MNLIGAGLGHNTDDAAAVASVFRRVIAGEKAELGDRVGIGIEQVTVIEKVVVQSAIQQIRHRISTPAGDAVIGIGAGRAAAGRAVVVVTFGDPGLKQSQIQHVASVQRHVGERSSCDRLPQSWVHGFNGGSLGPDFDGLILRSDFHLDVDAECLVDEQFLLGAFHRAKSRVLGGHLIIADGQCQYLEISLFVRGCAARVAGSRIGHGNLRARDHCPLLIVDCSENSSRCILS